MSASFRIRPLHADDLPAFRRMRRALWPDCEDREADELLAAPDTRSFVFVAEAEGGSLSGWAEVGTRRYAEGCATSPVAYLEGIWVEEHRRRTGVAAALVDAAVEWARRRGLSELASDFAPDNEASAAFHASAGFEEADRAVCVRRAVDAGGAAGPREGSSGHSGVPGPGSSFPPTNTVEGGSTDATPLTIRPVTWDDWDAVWAIFHEVVRTGDTYAYPPDTTRADALSTWIGAARGTYVAEADGRVLGTYYIKTNQPGQGDHVCNAGYMVGSHARGRGVGEAMCRHSLTEARRLGYDAMQYNLVVATNEGAIRLWKRMEFEEIGRLPGAFRHPERGRVDALVLYRELD